jgi:hypothetical protein
MRGRRDATGIRTRVMDDFRITRDVLLPLLLARRLIEGVECFVTPARPVA